VAVSLPGAPPIGAYVLRRIGQALLVLLGVSFVTFITAHATGDPVDLMVPDSTPQEERDALRVHLGLDRPVPAQFATFLVRALQGDLGYSFVQKVAVSELVIERLPATLQLALTAFVLSLILALPMGVFIALRRNTISDLVVTTLAMIGQAAPNFWLGLMLVILFAVELKLLPVSGYGDVEYLVLPAVTLALQSTARITRLVRSGMLEVLGSEYVRTARAKGLLEHTVLWVHAFRNAMIPVVTLAGLELAELVSGAFITETIFAWPGLGRLAINAVYQRDFPVIQGVVLVAAAGFVIINLLVDLLYTWIDPRVSLR
jgi:ABC-type dipeptide/oligopeptide/nickel transport system permease component